MNQWLISNKETIALWFGLFQTLGAIAVPVALFWLNGQNEKRKAEKQRKKEEISRIQHYYDDKVKPYIDMPIENEPIEVVLSMLEEFRSKFFRMCLDCKIEYCIEIHRALDYYICNIISITLLETDEQKVVETYYRLSVFSNHFMYAFSFTHFFESTIKQLEILDKELYELDEDIDEDTPNDR